MTPPAATDAIPTADVSVHLPVLLLGLRWLFDTEQPGTAIVRHDGQAAVSTPGRTLRFIPRGRVGFATIRVEPTDEQPVSSRELDAFAALLCELDVRVQHTWIESLDASGCLALLRPAHPTLCAATARYDRGCPVHRQPHWCTCGWYRDNEAQLVGLPQLQQQVLVWASATPTLEGPWPKYLDPSGLLSQTAAKQFGSNSLSTNRIGTSPRALSAGSGDPLTSV